jgi:hypothetical protein
MSFATVPINQNRPQEQKKKQNHVRTKILQQPASKEQKRAISLALKQRASSCIIVYITTTRLG